MNEKSDEVTAAGKQAQEAMDGCVRFVEQMRRYLAENRQWIDPASCLFLENSAVILVSMLSVIRLLSCKVMLDKQRTKDLETVNQELKEHLS